MLKDITADQLPTIIQRIRALHHPSLSAANNEAMADFSSILVDHLYHLGEQDRALKALSDARRSMAGDAPDLERLGRLAHELGLES